MTVHGFQSPFTLGALEVQVPGSVIAFLLSYWLLSALSLLRCGLGRHDVGATRSVWEAKMKQMGGWFSNSATPPLGSCAWLVWMRPLGCPGGLCLMWCPQLGDFRPLVWEGSCRPIGSTRPTQSADGLLGG